MFVSFEVENFGPFTQKIELSTQADMSKKEYLEANTFSVGEDRYNRVTYLYGFNGTGKSSIFRALLSMKQAIALSPIFASNTPKVLEKTITAYTDNLQQNYFKFSKGYETKPTRYGIRLRIDGVLYYYRFDVQNGKIVFEALDRKLKRRETILLRTSEKFEDITLKSELKSFSEFRSVVKENVLCLSMAMFLNNPLAVKIYQAIDDIFVVNMSAAGHSFTDLIEQEDIEWYTEIIREVDRTIKKLNISLEEKKENKKIQISDDFESKDLIIRQLKVDIESIHNVYENGSIIDEVALPFLQFESNGTIKLLSVLPAIMGAIKTGGVLFIDEIENGLHPIITRSLVHLFASSESNPKNAQLICSSHEIRLLDDKVRRDQVWCLRKNDQGQSELLRVSDHAGLRKDGFASKYFEEAFGGTPVILRKP